MMFPSVADSWLVLLVPISLIMGAVGLLVFMWCIRNHQFDDMEGDAMRIFLSPDAPHVDRSPVAVTAPVEKLSWHSRASFSDE